MTSLARLIAAISAAAPAPCEGCRHRVKCRDNTLACGDYVLYVHGGSGDYMGKSDAEKWRRLGSTPTPEGYEAAYPLNEMMLTRRKAAYAMNQLCRECGLGSMAHHFDGEEPSDWAPLNDTTLQALKNGRVVATVEVLEDRATIALPDCWGILRGKEREFQPEAYGFFAQKLDWLGEAEPYIMTIGLPDDIPGLHAPYNPYPRMINRRKPKVIRQL